MHSKRYLKFICPHAILFLSVLTVSLLVGCGGCRQSPPAPFGYTPRIGDTPPVPEADRDHIKFQITTRLASQTQPPSPIANVPIIQELVLREELFRNGELIYRFTENRKEVGITDSSGDWVDNHEKLSGNMDVFQADKCVYAVTAKQLRPRPLQPPPGTTSLPADTILSSSYQVEFGPGADAATRDSVNNGKPADRDLRFTYTAAETAIEYGYVWEVRRVEEIKSGFLEIKFTVPSSASALDVRKEF